MLQEVRDLGFEQAELGHSTRISLLPGILEAVDSGLIRISSLHNFCPLPMGVRGAAPNVFQFSSDDPRERENALRHTLKTLDFAARLKASLVVLHLGSVPLKGQTDRLKELAKEGQKDTPRYQHLCEEALEKREARKEPYVERVHEALRRLLPEAESRGLVLGIENREGLEEIPFEDDLPLLFHEFDSPVVRYWHDTGHAQIKENLGLLHHAMHLETYAERLGGFHVHDVEFPARDHRPPGKGTVDFVSLRPWVKPDRLKVFEFSPSLSAEEVQAGASHLRSLWGKE